jgi:hypothetical protein
MVHRLYRPVMPAAMILLATSACALHAVPSGEGASAQRVAGAPSSGVRPADTTSMLKRLTKQVVIGSTVDAQNGDEGPRAISVVPKAFENTLVKGQLLVCNYENSAGTAGHGTTMEVLNPKPSSKPVRFYQSDLIEGCDGVGITAPHMTAAYGSGFTSRKIVAITEKKGSPKTYSGDILDSPFSDTGADSEQNFAPLFIYAGSTADGGIVSISVGFYGNGQAIQVAKGFGVSHGPHGDLAPSGLQYDRKLDTLYIVDGVTNTVVAFSNATKLLEKDEIVVGSDGKTFKCLHPSLTCGTVVYSGAPLDAPMASALLPNGNLIVANTQGTANTLVELTPQGQVLDTRVVDTSSTQGVFGLAASGTGDSNTVLFFTDTNSNTVQELMR